jgi:endonuclease/exonuclease/phosphatase family metal-dependent hydrolase
MMKKGKKNKSKKKYSLRTKALTVVNGIFIILLLLCYINPYINPAHFPYFAFSALFYPFLLAFNLFFVLLWLIRGRLAFLYSTVAILLGINHLFTHFQFHNGTDARLMNKPSLKVLTYNVQLFGYYKGELSQQIRSDILAQLQKTDADVYCFQEFFENEKEFPMVDTLKSLLKAPYVYADYFLTLNKINHYGLAIFSRFPILDSGRIQENTKHANYSIYNDIVWNKDTVRIINNHLESIHLSKADYDFYEDLTTNPSENKDVKKGSVSILRKIHNAYRKRATQADYIKDYITKSPHPVVVCGDFNDTPLSYVYRRLSLDLRDGFVQAGFGMGKTYAGLFPSYRIDYLLFSPIFRAVQYRTYRKNYSDHYPTYTRLVLSDYTSKKNQ